MVLLIVSEAAKLLGLTPAHVRRLEREGRLPAQRTPGGVRLFNRDDVERLAAARRARGRKGPAR
jgi:excisionase family DNA binding protein